MSPAEPVGPQFAALTNAARAAGPPLLFGLRLWASVCLALYIAFWLELDNAYWAGVAAANVCQPHLGASLRRGWHYIVGTSIGAAAIVLMTAMFPQDRVLFLAALALWAAACALAATALRNFAAYAAAISGFTAAIIANDLLGATGGLNANEAFRLAVVRASEMSIGIASGSIVLAGTVFGPTRRQLAALFADLVAEIIDGFTAMLALAGPEMPETRPRRRELVRRIIALDPFIGEAIGESHELHDHSKILLTAVDGLFAAVTSWRTVAVNLTGLPHEQARTEASVIIRSISPELRLAEHSAPAIWTGNPIRLQQLCAAASRALIALPASTPSQELIAGQTAKLLAGISDALNGLALLAGDPVRRVRRPLAAQLCAPDWLPSFVNAARAFVAIGAVELFWIATAWPNGATAMVFATMAVLMFAPRADQAYATAIGYVIATILAAVFTAVIAFSVLPQLATFEAFCIAIGLYLVPVGALAAQPWKTAMFTVMAASFVRLLAPANEMSYDTVHYYNNAVAIVAGVGFAAGSFLLLPPLSPAYRARRLLALTLRDLRRLAIGRVAWETGDWEGRIYGRIKALPDEAVPLQRAQLVTALAVGAEIIQLRPVVSSFGLLSDLDAELAALARGSSAVAAARLALLDGRLATLSNAGTKASLALQARGSILAISGALSEHGSYFDSQEHDEIH